MELLKPKISGVSLKGVIQEISFLNSSELWMSIGIVLLRDFLRYTLLKKFESAKKIKVKKLRVYNLEEVLFSGELYSVILGMSLSRIIPINNYNVGLFPILTYDVVGFDNKTVYDRTIRNKYIPRVTTCSYDEFIRRMNLMKDLIFPLKGAFADKSINFDNTFYNFDSKEVKEKKPIVYTLDRWL